MQTYSKSRGIEVVPARVYCATDLKYNIIERNSEKQAKLAKAESQSRESEESLENATPIRIESVLNGNENQAIEIENGTPNVHKSDVIAD